MITDEIEVRKAKRRAAYRRRVAAPESPRSSRWRAGTRANKHRRSVPTFTSDRREAS